jgi:hypothetical protein
MPAATVRTHFAKLLWLALFWALAAMTPAQAQDAAALKARHAALTDALASNAFGRPLHLLSSESGSSLAGDIYARIEQPFAVVGPALRGTRSWCDILILHLNVKRCLASTAPGADSLGLVVGSKHDQAVADAYAFAFAYRVVADTPDYLQIQLNAATGPLGTSGYRIVLEVVALDGGRSFLHMSYSYGYGFAARVAMQGYLATVGRNKVGFSVVGKRPAGEPIYIAGTRGVIERNTMRYYLAIEAYLDALAAPAAQQLDRRLNAWHAGAERYPAQLHELELGEYLDMKHGEVQRQRALGS